jgi:opacity protein-like surface antigen
MNRLNPLSSSCFVTASTLVASALAACGAPAQPVPASPGVGFQKPAWLTDLSLAVKESYDNNIFLVSGDGATETDSWITSVSPKLGFNLAPLLGDAKTLQVLGFAYSPEFVVFHNADSEDFTAHRLANTFKGKVGAFSFNLENGFNYIDGNEDGPIYSAAAHDDQRSAYSTAVPRERREQFQDRTKIVLQYDLGNWFIRPTASFLYYDLMTNLRTNAGYQNYSDRFDVNGGADLGYRVTPNIAVTVGYRYGHQYQQQYPSTIDKTHTSSSSDYQRALIGLEGKPLKWLTVSALAGPDFRSYPGNSPTHATPMADKTPIKYFAEAALTAAISPNDTLAFKYKQWQWVSSTGKLPLFDSSYDLSYKRKLGKSLSLDLGGRIASSDYTGATGASAKRDDWMYTVSAGVNYAFTQNLSASLGYSIDLGRNAQDDLVLPQEAKYREFDHHLVSLGAIFKF